MDLSGSWEYIQNVARSRLAHNKTPHHDYRFGEGIEVIGVAGEIATRRFLGLTERVHEGWDGGVDINFYGLKIDVKATTLTPRISYRYLQWPTRKKIKSDVVVMTAIDPITKQGVVLGYATKDEILNAKVNPDRPTACMEISVLDLHPPFELIEARLRNIVNQYKNTHYVSDAARQ